MIKYRRFFIFVTVVFVLISCDNNVVYESTQKLNDKVWSYEDTIKFAFDIKDTSLRYNMYLDLDHHTSYPFQNLYLKIHSTFPDSEIITEQHSLELQEKNGEWMGSCSNGNCGIRFILKENMRFNQLGVHTIFLEQYTRTENLKGVESLGLLLKEQE